jgi:tRNA1(Val) A37 N6-methylase TrmN6
VNNAATLPPHTIDSFLGGRVTLMQPQKGHRAGLDAALLQAVIPADATGLLIDIGAGVGTVAFAAAARAPALEAVAVERDPDLVMLASQALTLPENTGFAERVRLMTADATDLGRLREGLGETATIADWVLMNPPFDTPGSVRQSPDAARRKAHVGSAALLEAWCRTATALLRPGGRLGLIHRGEALPAVLPALSGMFGDVCVLPAHPSEGAAASRIVVRAERASRAPFRLLGGLVLHKADGAWTDEADAILRGRAALAF